MWTTFLFPLPSLRNQHYISEADYIKLFLAYFSLAFRTIFSGTPVGAILILLVAMKAFYVADQKMFTRQIVFFNGCLASPNL